MNKKRFSQIFALLLLVLIFISYSNTAKSQASQTVLLTAPTSGETWEQGKTYNITWHAPQATNPLTIDLHRATGGCSPCQTGPNTFVRSLAVGVSNTGTYSWTITNDIIADSYFIYIYEQGKTPYGDASNQSFRVTGQTVNAQLFTFEGNKFLAKAQNGVITYLKNKLTGTEYIISSGPSSQTKTSVLFKDGAQHRTPDETLQDVTYPSSSQTIFGNASSVFQPDDRTVIWSFVDGAQQSQVSISLDQESDDLVFRVKTSGTRANLHRLRYALTGIDHGKLDIVLPVNGGIRIKQNETTIPRDYFIWPLRWNAQFAVLQGNNEGFWIRSDDVQLTSKGLEIDRQTAGRIALGFDTEAQFPFSDKTNLQSVSWRLTTYKGSWTLPVHQYRLWMEKNYVIPARANWVNSIKMALWYAPVSLDSTLNALSDLSRLINPSKVLIGTGDWRVNSWAQNFPDYSVNQDWNRRHNILRQMSYAKVMLWMNSKTTHKDNAAFTTYQQWQEKDPITESGWPSWIPAMAYIAQAKDAWRNDLVSRIVSAWNSMQSKPPALYLDESLMIVRNSAPVIDGKNAVQGNLQLHKDFLASLPVATVDRPATLAGEGLNEVSFRHEAFTQGPVWKSRQWFDPQWNYTVDEDIHHLLLPVHSLLFSPFTRLFAYAGTNGVDEGSVNAIKAFNILRYDPNINKMPYNAQKNIYYLCENDDGSRGNTFANQPLNSCLLNSSLKSFVDRANGKTQHPPTVKREQAKAISANVFRFLLTYTDVDGEGPGTEPDAYVRVVVDGVPYDMTPASAVSKSAYVTGVKFTVDLPLAAGSHSYYFEVWDTWKVVRSPINGQLSLSIAVSDSTRSGAEIVVSESENQTLQNQGSQPAGSGENTKVITCLDVVSNLAYGSKDSTGMAVFALQNFLQARGHLNASPTGFFGILTLRALRDFQRANRISPTGFVSPPTREKIKSLTCKQ